MSAKEPQKVGIMQQVDKNTLTLRKASVELSLSLRQIKRIRKRYQAEELKGLFLSTLERSVLIKVWKAKGFVCGQACNFFNIQKMRLQKNNTIEEANKF